jgi:ribonucleotide monophosphatase NagD (HAD superfamily)
VFFVSNNARKKSHEYAEKMRGMGYASPKEDHIYGSAKILAQCIPKDVRKVFLVGMKSLREELEEKGITVLGGDQDYAEKMPKAGMTEWFENFEVDKEVGAVVVGMDTSFNYEKLCIASLYL